MVMTCPNGQCKSMARQVLVSEGGYEVYQCADCGAIFGSVANLEASYVWVKNEWLNVGLSKEQERYFSFKIGEVGNIRRAGWFDRESRKLTAVCS